MKQVNIYSVKVSGSKVEKFLLRKMISLADKNLTKIIFFLPLQGLYVVPISVFTKHSSLRSRHSLSYSLLFVKPQTGFLGIALQVGHIHVGMLLTK